MADNFTLSSERFPRHVGIIMDGNGRWAEKRGLPRSLGHVKGVKALRRVIEAALGTEVAVITLYAFSCDNWGRPKEEVGALMRLFHQYLLTETARATEQGVRLNFIGRRDRLEPSLVRAIEEAEHRSAGGTRLTLRIAVDYSSRETLLKAFSLTRPTALDTAGFSDLVELACHSVKDVGPADLIIRTAGEQRLSDFLLWESAYAELYFTDVLWPDFAPKDFELALRSYALRCRKFGKLPPSAETAA